MSNWTENDSCGVPEGFETLGEQPGTWEGRIQVLVAEIERILGLTCKNPEDAVCNVVCNHCGLLAAATIREPPAGWHIGGLGENDYCPECRTKAT